MSEYKVQQVNDHDQRKFAVTFEGFYRFVVKKRDQADKLAEKLNRIHRERMAKQ